MNIILIGMMGSGKTTIGKKLAESLGWTFKDMDLCIEEDQNISIPEIFASKGEPYFRSVEKKVIKETITGNHFVFATGGGAPCNEENWNHMKKNGFIIWLKSSPQKLLERLQAFHPDARPLLKNNLTLERISEILSKRESYYGKADWILETDSLTAEETIKNILNQVRSNNLLQ